MKIRRTNKTIVGGWYRGLDADAQSTINIALGFMLLIVSGFVITGIIVLID